MCYIFNKDYFCQKKFTEENIFFRPIDLFIQEILIIIFSSNYCYGTMQNMYRDFLKVGFAQKENVLHVFLNGECELMAIL